MNRLHLPVIAATILAACVSGAAPADEASGTVTGVVSYDGAEAGGLRVAVFATFPPRGAPVAEVAIDAPVFPQAYQVTGVPPGRYFVLAIIDTVPDDGDRYRPQVDPGGAFGRYDSPATITVTTTGATSGVDLRMVAPAPGSPWDR